MVRVLKRPTSTAITLHALSGEFAIAMGAARYRLRTWCVASSTKVAFAWGRCECSNNYWRLIRIDSRGRPVCLQRPFPQKARLNNRASDY